MGKLITTAITSLDGYVADTDGKFDWSVPDEEVHAFVNDLERPIGTYLYGRRMYEVMRFWETAHSLADQLAFVLDYAAVWQAADKIVYSRTLDAVSTARTRMNREFDPDAVRRLKEDTDQDLSVSGPDLAAHAIRAGWSTCAIAQAGERSDRSAAGAFTSRRPAAPSRTGGRRPAARSSVPVPGWSRSELRRPLR